MAHFRLPPGLVWVAVRQHSVEEIWYFLTGVGRVWRQPPAGEPLVDAVGPGTVLTIPTGWAFQFQADASSDLRFLCCTSPPWPGADEAEAVAQGGL